ncbi:MAG: hypothetical protein ACRERU_12510 [Methylococcales bacterium]
MSSRIGSRKSPENGSDSKQNQLAELITPFPLLGQTYRLKRLFNDLRSLPGQSCAHAFLDRRKNYF